MGIFIVSGQNHTWYQRTFLITKTEVHAYNHCVAWSDCTAHLTQPNQAQNGDNLVHLIIRKILEIFWEISAVLGQSCPFFVLAENLNGFRLIHDPCILFDHCYFQVILGDISFFLPSIIRKRLINEPSMFDWSFDSFRWWWVGKLDLCPCDYFFITLRSERFPSHLRFLQA